MFFFPIKINKHVYTLQYTNATTSTFGFLKSPEE